MKVLLHVVIAAIVIPLVITAADFRPASLRSSYRRAVDAALARDMSASDVTEADIAAMPRQVQAYLRRAGVVGRPRVRSLHAEFDADMRFGPTKPWMRSSAEQFEFFEPAERLFFMKSRLYGLPFDVFHQYVNDSATMRAKAVGLVSVVNARGAEMTRSETVTLFNDMCVFAPGALIGAPVTWTPVSDTVVRAAYTNAGYTISATLFFDANGDLVNFRSDERSRADGRTMQRLPWTTPLRDNRDFGGVRLAARGDAQWTDSAGTWTYGRFTLRRIQYNVTKMEW